MRVLDVVLRVVGFLSIPVLALSVALMIRSLKKYQPIRLKSLLIQMGIPVVMLVVYALLLGLDPPKLASGALFVVGGGVGITQLLAVFARSEYAAWGLSTLYFSLGLTSGTNGMLLVSSQRILAGEIDAPPARYPASSGVQSGVAFAGAGGYAFPAQKAAWMAELIAAGPYCPAWGRAVGPGKRFCTGCGAEAR